MQLEFKKKGPTRDMLYFKNSELAYTYHVSVKTVSNWIESTKQGKLDLTLTEHNGRSYVTNSARNIAIIEDLVEKGKKYRPHRALKVVSPKPEFYRLYNEAQIYDIVSNLEIHHEIPRQYNYFDGGAANWDEYTQHLAAEEGPNLLNSTIKLLEINASYLDEIISKYERVNIIDIGVGNALPVRDFLGHLLEIHKLERYIGLDISARMLEIAEANIKGWFGNRVRFEGYELDINYERFVNILAEEYMSPVSQKTINIILFFGGTLYNFRKPDGALRVIHDSMGLNDILIYADKLDTENARRYFDFNPDPSNTELAPNHRFIFDLLNIDDSFYEVERGFDKDLRQRYIRVRLKVALTIRFEFEIGERLVELSKGETILLWRAWDLEARKIMNEFDKSDFYNLHSSQTADHEYLLTVSQIKRD